MRKPEHDFIAINVSAEMADRLEELVGPNFTLALYPDDLQDQHEDAIPSYFFAVTDMGAAVSEALAERRSIQQQHP